MAPTIVRSWLRWKNPVSVVRSVDEIGCTVDKMAINKHASENWVSVVFSDMLLVGIHRILVKNNCHIRLLNSIDSRGMVSMICTRASSIPKSALIINLRTSKFNCFAFSFVALSMTLLQRKMWTDISIRCAWKMAAVRSKKILKCCASHFFKIINI